MLAEVVSVDAWHQPLRTDGGTSSVHVELTFQEGRMGGDDEKLPFTFRVKLKKAVLTIKPEDPLRVDRSSVARPIMKAQAEQEQSAELRTTEKRDNKLSGSLDVTSHGPKASGKAEFGSDKSSTEERVQKIKRIQEIPLVFVTARSAVDGYAWEMKPGQGDFLQGQPWHPVEEPRLGLKSLDRKLPIDPAVKVTLSCFFEDIVIEDIRIKRDDIIGIAKEVVFNEANEKSAAQYIKIALQKADIEVGAVDNRFAELVLADLLAAEE